jgi:hypothetical protein
VFEVDQVLLAGGTVLLAHDGLEANYGLRKPFQQATWRDLAGHRYGGRYTLLRSQDMLRLLADHPDAFLIPDPSTAGRRSSAPTCARPPPWAGSTCWSASCRTWRTRPS